MADFDSQSVKADIAKSGNGASVHDDVARIAIVGAGGRIARRTAGFFYDLYADATNRPRVELIALSSHAASVESELEQLRNTHILRTSGMREDNFRNLTTRVVSTYDDLNQKPDYRALRRADLIVVAPHIQPTQEMVETFPPELRDRAAWSYSNRDMMIDIFRNIRGNAPDADVLILTSDVDDFSALGQEHGLKTYGFGGHLDTMRAQVIIGDRLQNSLNRASDNKKKIIQRTIRGVLMGGYHDGGMRLLQSTLAGLDLTSQDVDYITEQVAAEGLDTATKGMNKRPSGPQDLEATVIMPAFALADVLGAYAGYAVDGGITATHNVKLINGDAVHYGVEPETRLGVPTKVTRRNIRILRTRVIEEEKKYFVEAADEKRLSYEQLRDWNPERPGLSAQARSTALAAGSGTRAAY